jgi:RNA polymerase sigma-70 factor, ECF subfamily
MGDGSVPEASPARADDGLPADVLRRFRVGDRDAFLLVHGAYAPAVRKWVARYFARAFDQEEAVQEVWLSVHRARDTYEPERGEVVPWLRAVAANCCKQMLRARGRRINADDEPSENLEAPTANPETEVQRANLISAVERFAASLDPQEAQVLKLALRDELPHEEVSRRLGVTIRRSKYLKKKVLLRAISDPALRRALLEIIEDVK